MTNSSRDWASKKPLGAAFVVQKQYVLEGYFDQEPTMPKEWRRLTDRIFKLKGAALNAAKATMAQETWLAKNPTPYPEHLAARISEIRITEYVFVLDRSSVVATLLA